MTTSELDTLRETLLFAREARDRAGRECADHVRSLGEDNEAYRLADRWLVLDSNVRRLERAIARGVGG